MVVSWSNRSRTEVESYNCNHRINGLFKTAWVSAGTRSNKNTLHSLSLLPLPLSPFPPLINFLHSLHYLMHQTRSDSQVLNPTHQPFNNIFIVYQVLNKFCAFVQTQYHNVTDRQTDRNGLSLSLTRDIKILLLVCFRVWMVAKRVL